MSDSESSYTVGTLVEHPGHPEWGPGKVLAVRGPITEVYFRDVPGRTQGDAVKKFKTAPSPLRVAETQNDPQLDNLPPYDAAEFKSKARRVSLEEGVEVFLGYFPEGFADPGYLGDRKSGERNYKLKAHRLYVDTLGDGQAESLLLAGDIDELRRRMLAVQGRTNLLFPTEAAAFRDGLRDDRAAKRFFEALTALLSAPGPDEAHFEALADAAASLPAEEDKTSPWKWTVTTVLPFLAQPEKYIFVKPTPTQQCAERMSFDIQYRSNPNWITYRKVLELADVLLERLRPLGARDMIDAQSFMWVIATYDR